MSGRPSAYTDAIADAICERLADGRSLRSICLDEGMPTERSIYRWLASNDEFRQQYARAREDQADALFDEMLDIADAGDMHDPVDVQAAKLRIDTRKWMAGKLRPKVYGDKAEVEHTHKLSEEAAAWLGLTS